jgi:hypothetical protein
MGAPCMGALCMGAHCMQSAASASAPGVCIRRAPAAGRPARRIQQPGTPTSARRPAPPGPSGAGRHAAPLPGWVDPPPSLAKQRPPPPAHRPLPCTAATVPPTPPPPSRAQAAAAADLPAEDRATAAADALLLAWFAAGNSSVFAAQCLVETVIECYRRAARPEQRPGRPACLAPQGLRAPGAAAQPGATEPGRCHSRREPGGRRRAAAPACLCRRGMLVEELQVALQLKCLQAAAGQVGRGWPAGLLACWPPLAGGWPRQGAPL